MNALAVHRGYVHKKNTTTDSIESGSVLVRPQRDFVDKSYTARLFRLELQIHVVTVDACLLYDKMDRRRLKYVHDLSLPYFSS